jgi:hypothetical protein
MEEDKAGAVDSFLKKIMSRKLMVWLTTTGLLFGSVITGEQWLTVSMIYIGTQGLMDIVAKRK